jgi:ribosome-associated protein
MSRRDDDDNDAPSARQLARGEQRRAGEQSARLASALMKLPASALARLELDDDLRTAIDRARAVTSQIARRRAERTLAGELRRVDLDGIARQLEAAGDARAADARQFHLAEHWRAKLLEEGSAGTADFPGGADDELVRLIDAARRERDTGRPPGAGKALFRHIVNALRAGAADERG